MLLNEWQLKEVSICSKYTLLVIVVSYVDIDDESKKLSTATVIKLLRENKFRFTRNWKKIGASLNVPKTEVEEIETDLKSNIYDDFAEALEECVDHWMRNSDDPNWVKLIEVIAQYDNSSANRMREFIGLPELSKL